MVPSLAMHAKPALPFALVLLAACGDTHSSSGVASAANAASSSPAAPATPPLARRARSQDPQVVALRHALDLSQLGEVRARLEAATRAPDETAELRARAAALEGRTLEALRLLEVARQERPSDAALFAASAEIYGVAQKFETAWSELKRGDEACGPSAELTRARGILWILKEGGAKKGLELLEKARAADPELAFSDRALAQAHLLVAKLAAKEGDMTGARLHVERSLSFDAQEVDALRLRADLCAAAGEFATSLHILEELVKQGEPLGSELALMNKKAAVAALLGHERPKAIQRFQRARELGLSDEELGTGAQILADEARARTEEGIAAYGRGELDPAEQAFRAALACDPGALAAQNHLAVVLFRREQFAQAAELWRAVLEGARKQGVELPEPVHLNLAKALVRAGEREAARSVAQAYLDAHADGRWAAPTRAWLDESAR